MFASSDVSDLPCSKTHLFILLVVQGICRALVQHRISNESIFFSLSLFTVQLFYLYIVTGNMTEGRVLPLVSNDTSSFFVIFS